MVPLSPVQCQSVREPSRSPQEALSVLWGSRHARGYDVLYLRESLKGVTAIASPQVRAWRCPAAGTRAHMTQAFHLARSTIRELRCQTTARRPRLHTAVGTSHVEDTWNLLGHALRKAVGLAAQELGTSTEVLVEKSRAGAGGAQPSQNRAEPRLKEPTTSSGRAF
jgi:hypothetical protein